MKKASEIFEDQRGSAFAECVAEPKVDSMAGSIPVFTEKNLRECSFLAEGTVFVSEHNDPLKYWVEIAFCRSVGVFFQKKDAVEYAEFIKSNRGIDIKSTSTQILKRKR